MIIKSFLLEIAFFIRNNHLLLLCFSLQFLITHQYYSEHYRRVKTFFFRLKKDVRFIETFLNIIFYWLTSICSKDNSVRLRDILLYVLINSLFLMIKYRVYI